MTTPESTPDRTVVYTSEHRVGCDGGGALGHPLTFYALGTDHDRAECRYCDRVFIYKPEGHA